MGGPVASPSLLTVLREWGRIGVIGFGGPPTHIRLFRQRFVDERGWIDAAEFEDAIAACNLLPGPASTQLGIFCAFRLRGRAGAVAGGLAFIVPGLVVIVGLAALFLGSAPPRWVLGPGAGAGAAVVAVALTGPWLVLVLFACGLVELAARRLIVPGGLPSFAPMPLLVAAASAGAGGLIALCWVAIKVGALAYGGGFVIIPLMQSDAVNHYHWMTGAQFLNAVALGQVTPGPVVQTVAAVGYAATGVGGGRTTLGAALVGTLIGVAGGPLPG